MSDVLVLCYHAMSRDWGAGFSATPDRLEAQIGSLLERGYEGATFSDAVNRPLAERTLAVTFDDSYRSVIELAAPVLARLGVPGTVFVIKICRILKRAAQRRRPSRTSGAISSGTRSKPASA